MDLHEEEELAAAAERAEALRKGPFAVSARYDRRIGRVVVTLNSGIEIGFSPHMAQGLEGALSVQLKEIEITPSGLGLHWPQLDADLYLPALLEGVMGAERWMAARLGGARRKSDLFRQGCGKPAKWKAWWAARAEGYPGIVFC